MKKLLCAFLALLLCLLAGCKLQINPPGSLAGDSDLSLSEAFRSKDVPDGFLTPETVAFYRQNALGGVTVRLYPLDEVYAQADAVQTLPRPQYYGRFLDEEMKAVVKLLDFALAGGYTRFAFPSGSITHEQINDADYVLKKMFHMDLESAISSLTVATRSYHGAPLYYNYVCVTDWEAQDMDSYKLALAEAERIVAEMPAEYTQAEKASYLYSYITKTVRYSEEVEYLSWDWSLVYDALANHKSISTGYAGALQLLYNLAGIDCITVQGYFYYENAQYYHEWNAAQIDGRYYLFDSTYDEGVAPGQYEYFGLSLRQLDELDPRTLPSGEAERLPECSGSLSFVHSAIYGG